MSEKHDKSTTKAEKVWIASAKSYDLGVKSDYTYMPPETKMRFLPLLLCSNKKTLNMLAKICEDPGKLRSEYVGADKTAFYAIDTLKGTCLIEERREPYARYGKLFPTEEGRAVYTGMWYAANNAPLVPRLQSRGLPSPPVFWSPDSLYTLSRADEPGYYFLVDTTAESPDKDMAIHDVFIDTDGDMWFSIDGLAGRFSIDVEEQLEADEGEAKECLREIIGLSRLKAAEKAAKAYDGLVDDADEE